MNVLHNGEIVPYDTCKVTIEDRSFMYGDGLFETMLCNESGIRLVDYHLKRLRRGCNVLGLEFPSGLNSNKLNEWVAALVGENISDQEYRVKLMVWRVDGGLYTPVSDSSNYLLKVHKSNQVSQQPREFVVVSDKVTNQDSVFSPFKTTSSLKYVLAAKEMKSKGADDIIILDQEGNVSEALYSNIFWCKDGAIFTPKSSTGCIEGTMRQFFLDRDGGNSIQQVQESLESLLEADQVLLTNSLGIFQIKKLLEREYEGRNIPKQLRLP